MNSQSTHDWFRSQYKGLFFIGFYHFNCTWDNVCLLYGKIITKVKWYLLSWKDGMSFVPEQWLTMARLAVVAEWTVGKQDERFSCPQCRFGVLILVQWLLPPAMVFPPMTHACPRSHKGMFPLHQVHHHIPVFSKLGSLKRDN